MSGHHPVKINIKQRIVSTAHGQVGNWSHSTTMLATIMPRTGDLLGLAGGHAVPVQQVTVWEWPELPLVELATVRTDSNEILAELAARGWDQNGGPWAGQQGSPE